MTKKQLYLVIALLSGLLLYVFFMPTQAPEEQAVEVVEDATVVADESAQLSDSEESETKEDKEGESEEVTLEGTFVGLIDGEDPYQKKFKYLLLNDGVEVLRINLRPLIGFSDINVIEKLGVSRGDRVVLTGVINDGEFFVESIQ